MKNNLEIKIPISRSQQELMDKMLKEISSPKTKAVSFKLFGTLIHQLFSEEYDIFLLMEQEFPEIRTAKKSFSDLRIEAEAEAVRNHKEKYSVNISQIYDILMKKAKISPETRDKLLKRECDLTVELTIPRNFGKKLFETALDCGKKTVITAETIYPRPVIVKILSRCGLERCNELIVTNELNNDKNPKDIVFSAVLKKISLSPEMLLHVGGNVEADVELPITKGSKALLLSDSVPNMEKSGKLRGYAEAERIYDYSTVNYLALHLAFGLYAAYIFDIPKSRDVHSDFCGCGYILGFIVYGTYKLIKDHELTEKQRNIISAIEKNDEIRRGGENFSELFRLHFGEFQKSLSFNGFSLPLEFLEKHCDSGDMELLKDQLSAEEAEQWKNSVTEPSFVRPDRKKTQRTAAEKLADRMFPPGTRVRNIADGILFKMKVKSKL